MSGLSSAITRRQALQLTGGLAAGLFLHACSKGGSSSASKPLISGVNPWPGYSGHYVALAKDLFTKAGAPVQEVFFQSASESITGFLASKVDLIWVTSGDALEMIHKDPTIRMIYVVDYSDGSDGIMGRGIQQPQDLKGKTLGRENLLFENVLLRAYLAKGGLTDKDLTIKDMSAADAAAAFAAKRVDAAVSYEPWLTKAAKEGGGDVIYSTKNTNLIADVIAVRQSLIQNRKADILNYLKAIDQGVKLVNSGDKEAIQIVSTKLNVGIEDAKAQIAGVKILDINDNKTIAFNESNENNVFKNFELNVKTAVDMKLIPEEIPINTLYDDSIIKAL